MARYSYKGNAVIIPPTAEIPREFLPNGRFAVAVQELIDNIEPWRGSRTTFETYGADDFSFEATVVRNGGKTPMWYKHVGHKARRVDYSPFLARRPSATSWLSAEFLKTKTGEFMLVRVWPGDFFLPPLPWQQSARNVDGGVERCVKYWRRHSYVFCKSRVRSGSRSNTPPNWFAQNGSPVLR